MIPEPIKNFADAFSKLPSIGPRQAMRLGFYLTNADKNELNNIEEAIKGIKRLRSCSQCFSIHAEYQSALCPVCLDKNRNVQIIAVVEKNTDLISIEKTGKFKGHYLVIGAVSKDGILSPAQKLRLQTLQNRTKKQNKKLQEIILAFNPTVFGDFSATIIEQELRPYAEKISRLGKGIPTGGEIEFADEETLGSALERRL